MRSLFKFIAAALILGSTPAIAQPTPAERRMAAYTIADAAHGEALLERLVNQNSGTLNSAGVRAVADMLRPEFESLGFAVRWIDGAAWGRAGHLIATHRGNGQREGRGRRVLMIGHLDTVFEPDNPFRGYRTEGRRAIGPGVSDDKGGIIVILGALRAMHHAGTLRGADIMVVLTGDEERLGAPPEAARADLIAAGRWADAAIEYENMVTTSAGPFATVARRSSRNWVLRATGRTGHSSGVFGPTAGYGAIFELSRIIDAWRRELPEQYLTFNVGVMAGGTPATLDPTEEVATGTGKTNIIPADAIARGDLRALTPEQDERIRARMAEIVAQHLPGTSATLTFSEGYPPMAPTDGNRALLARLNAVNRDLGLPELAEYDPAGRGAADSGFVAADVDTLGGMGAVGGRAHAEGEWLDLDSLPTQALRSAVLISRLTRERRQR